MVALCNASDTVVELGSFESIQYNTTLASSVFMALSTVLCHVFRAS
jgi:hypothetical protein